MTLEQALEALAKAQQALGAEKARADKADADLKAATARADKAEGERDTAKARADKADATAAPAAIDKAVQARVSLIDSARKVLGTEAKFDGKSDRDVRVAVLVKLDSKFTAEGRSDEYVIGRFDSAVDSVTAAPLAEAQSVLAGAPRADGAPAGESMIEKAIREQKERGEKARQDALSAIGSK